MQELEKVVITQLLFPLLTLSTFKLLCMENIPLRREL
jgi:hypothetical protein